MRSGYVIVGVLVAYLGFEAYAIKRAGHRTKPAYIHSVLIKARTAVERCQPPDAALEERFERTLDRLTIRYQETLAKQNPGMSQAQVNELIAEQAAMASAEIDERLSSSDCLQGQIRDEVRRYTIYAKKSR